MDTEEARSTPDTLYRLLPSLRVATLGSRHYFYDAAPVGPVIQIPTQRIRERLYLLTDRLLRANPTGAAWTLSQWQGLCYDPQDRDAIDLLVRLGYLEAIDAPPVTADPPPTERDSGNKAAVPVDYRAAAAQFDDQTALNSFRRRSFFNLPEDIEDAEVQVGLLGMPLASTPISAGTAIGPECLRLRTQQTGFWFDIYRTGFYSELTIEDEMPEILCRNVMAKDYGDLDAEVRTVDDLMGAVRSFVDSRLVEKGLPFVFVGGDHAITFPIVDALVRHHPDLCLIHLDAHNDLFFTESIHFNHAATVYNLLAYSRLQQVCSFGLRSWFDTRVKGVSRLASDAEMRERIHLYSLHSFKRLILDPDRFREVLCKIGKGRPCYLSIDLDVLSPGEMGYQLSTPAGAGLEWWELLEAVRQVMAELNVIASDIVEYNPIASHRRPDDPRHPAHLLLLLIHGLAGNRLRAG